RRATRRERRRGQEDEQSGALQKAPHVLAPRKRESEDGAARARDREHPGREAARGPGEPSSGPEGGGQAEEGRRRPGRESGPEARGVAGLGERARAAQARGRAQGADDGREQGPGEQDG